MAAQTDGERIIALEIELKGLREQHKAHAEDTRRSIDGLTAQVAELVGVMNRGKGAFGFAMVLAGSVGAVAANLVASIYHGVAK